MAPHLRGLTALASVGLLWLVFASAVFAHHAGEAEVVITSEAIPGSPMTIVGSYLPEGVDITLHLRNGERDVVLGVVTTDDAGAFTSSPSIPEDFPTGPARLVALDASETPVEYEVVIGRRAEDPAAQAEPLGGATLLWLAAGTLGASLALIALVAWAVRRGARRAT